MSAYGSPKEPFKAYLVSSNILKFDSMRRTTEFGTERSLKKQSMNENIWEQTVTSPNIRASNLITI